MADDNVIKFGKARKKLARQRREAKASENRVKFGRTKSEKQAEETRKTTLKEHVEGHKRDLDED